MVNAGTEQYLQECLRAGSALRSAARDLVLPDTYADSYGKLLLDRPLLIPADDIHFFGDDLRGLFRLLVSLPDRLFDGDLAGYCAAVSLDSRLSERWQAALIAFSVLFGLGDRAYSCSFHPWLISLVPQTSLPQANAFANSTMGIGQFAGPSIGVVLTTTGSAPNVWLTLAFACTVVTVLLSLLRIRTTKVRRTSSVTTSASPSSPGWPPARPSNQ